MNTNTADYKAGFRAGMEYQERVEIDLLDALIELLECPAGDYDYEDACKKAHAAIAKATGGDV